jgi:arylsulfatase A-like enzyme
MQGNASLIHTVFSAVAVCMAVLVAGACSATGYAAPPNFVVILADDLGWGDMRANNPDRSRIPTPQMDRLAAGGMRFTDGHSSSGCCSPSRYTLLTGRYHWRTSLQSGIVPVWGAPLIAADRMTIASLAKSRGYATACIGKWHLGRKWPITPAQKSLFTGFGGKAGGGGSVSTEVTQAHRDAWQAVFSQPIPEGPTTRGFDQYFGTDVPNWPPYCFIENGRIRPAFRDQRSPTGNWNQFFRRLLIVLPPLFAPTPKRRAHSCSTCH